MTRNFLDFPDGQDKDRRQRQVELLTMVTLDKAMHARACTATAIDRDRDCDCDCSSDEIQTEYCNRWWLSRDKVSLCPAGESGNLCALLTCVPTRAWSHDSLCPRPRHSAPIDPCPFPRLSVCAAVRWQRRRRRKSLLPAWNVLPLLLSLVVVVLVLVLIVVFVVLVVVAVAWLTAFLSVGSLCLRFFCLCCYCCCCCCDCLAKGAKEQCQLRRRCDDAASLLLLPT